MALESSSSTAEVIARHQLCHNRNIPIEEIVEKIEKVGKDDVMKAAQYIFNSKPTYTLLGNLEKYPSYEDVEKMVK